MQSFTRAEIAWIANEMKKQSEQMSAMCNMADTPTMERELCRLRAEQYASIADKLFAIAKGKGRRIEIING